MRKFKLKTENPYFSIVEFEYDGYGLDLEGIEDNYDSLELYDDLESRGAKNIVVYTKEELGKGFEIYYES